MISDNYEPPKKENTKNPKSNEKKQLDIEGSDIRL